MAAVADILTRVRLELGDLPTQFTATLAGDGTTADFYIGYKPVDASYATFTYDGSSYSTYTYGGNQTGLVVKINGTTKAQGTDYTVEETTGIIHFTTAPALYASIVVTGTHFRYFTTAELITFIKTAVLQHTDNRTDSFGRTVTIDLIKPVEEYPVALLATVEALWALATDASFDINISAPDGVAIPRGQRFQQLSAIINARKEQYRELCSALNVGLWRIEMGTLRRVSRTTNRLVPVYMPQEIDDSTPAERVFVENNLKGRSVVPDPVAVYDIVFTQGDTWTVQIDLPIDLTSYNLVAQVRTYPGSPLLVATPTITATDLTNGKVTLSLTSDQTYAFPLKSFWDLQVYSNDGTFNQTYLRGVVFAERQVTDASKTVLQPYLGPTFTAANPPLTATKNVAFNYAFTASGTSPTYVISSGALPTGLKLSKDGTGVDAGHNAGAIYGTPTVAGTFNYAVTVTSSYVVNGVTNYLTATTPNFAITVS